MVDLLVLLAFIAFGLVSWHFRISHRVSIVTGLLFLLVAEIVATAGGENVANSIAILAYYSLVVGVTLAIVEQARTRRLYVVQVEHPRASHLVPRATSRVRQVAARVRRMIKRS